MFFTPEQLREHEAQWFSSGAANVADALAEAGAGVARALAAHFPKPGTLWLFLGPGHNAGDAIVAARHLQQSGWIIRHHFALPDRPVAQSAQFSRWTGRANPSRSSGFLSPLTASHFDALAPHSIAFDPNGPPGPVSLPRPWVSLDGLCGIGARLPLGGSFAEAVQAINRWRGEWGVHTVSVDLPSGLDGATGLPSDPCVTADITITLAAVKRGLVLAPNPVGRLVLVPLESLPVPEKDPERRTGPIECLLTSDLLAPWLPPRPHDLHKGGAGRVALIAGSPGMTGAAALAAMGALHAGAGLVTVFCPESCAAEVAARCPPEAMVRHLEPDAPDRFPFDAFDAIAIGPGCGRFHDAWLADFARDCPLPLVLDADALNGLAAAAALAQSLPENPPAARVLTPHPGEFARLCPDLAPLPRPDAAAAFTCRHPGATLLFKGRPTIVARSGSPLAYNQTGHSGLACGGSGDLLTGILAALLVRQPDAWRAACLSAWLHGRAAELATYHGNESTESLVASSTARWLGPAFLSLARRDP